PLTVRGTTVGAFNLFRKSTGTLSVRDATLARALAEVATVSILQDRRATEQDVLSKQLQAALESRVMIEQAKGAIAHRNELTVVEAFQLLRGHARANNMSLADVSRGVLDRSISL
ncbi:MAG TPA: ANTAR domain-containing protein, partial [Micrococcaceae bacterium]